MSTRKKFVSILAAIAVTGGAVLAGAAPANAADRRGECENAKPCVFIHADWQSDPWGLAPWPTGSTAKTLWGHPLDNQISSIYMRTGKYMAIYDNQYGFDTNPGTVAGWNQLGNLAYVGWNDKISAFKTL